MPINMGGRLSGIQSRVKHGFLPRILRFANNRSGRAIGIHDKFKRNS